jgi:hypothetical protein
MCPSTCSRCGSQCVRTMRTFPLVRAPKILLLPWFPVMIHMRYLSECVLNSTQFLHLPFFSLHNGLTRCSCVDLQVPAEAAEAAEGWWCAKIPHLELGWNADVWLQLEQSIPTLGYT